MHPPFSWLAFPLTALAAFYLSTIFHELGHAVCGRLVGFQITSVGLGTGKPFFVLRLRGVPYYLARKDPLQGLTFAALPDIIPRPYQLIVFLSGGILAHLALTGAGCLWWWFGPGLRWVGLAFALVNGLSAALQLLPMPITVGYATFQSDGAFLWRLFRHGVVGPPAPHSVTVLHQFREFWWEIGAIQGLHSYHLFAADNWSDLGGPERVAQLLDEADDLPEPPHPAFQAYALILRGRSAETEKTAEAFFAQADDLYARINHPIGLALVRLCRPGQDPSGDDPGKDLLASCDALEGSLLALELEARAVGEKGPELKALWVRYQALPSVRRQPANDLRVYRALAGYFARRGKKRAARIAYRRVLTVCGELLQALPDADDQEYFRRCQTPLLEEAQQYLRGIGRKAEAESVGQNWPTREELDRRRLKAEEALRAKRRRTGSDLALLNGSVAFLLGFLLIMLFPPAGPKGTVEGIVPGVGGLHHLHFHSVLIYYVVIPLALSVPVYTACRVATFLGVKQRWFTSATDRVPEIPWMVALILPPVMAGLEQLLG